MIKIGNHTYIPIGVVPKVYKPIFINKPVKPTKENLEKYVIKVNDKVYKPITKSVHKSIVVGGEHYIPVHVAKTTEKKEVIVPN